jgi:hypothetical protein
VSGSSTIGSQLSSITSEYLSLSLSLSLNLCGCGFESGIDVLQILLNQRCCDCRTSRREKRFDILGVGRSG